MTRTVVGIVVVLLAGGVGTAGAQVQGPLAELDFLTRAPWEGRGEGYSTALRYRWEFPGRVLRASNEVLDASGGVIARYEGAYAWDAGRGEIAVWIASDAGEVHRGRAWIEDGVLWHEMAVSGGGIEVYASAMRRVEDGLRYHAAYGTPEADASLLATAPIVYRAAGTNREPDIGSSSSPALIRVDGEIEVAAAPTAVWEALTTPEGLAGWIAPESRVELRPGGAYELYFTPDGEDRGMEGTRVLAFVPEALLATSGEAPNTWSVWRLDEVRPGATRVRFTGLGDSEEWAARAGYFRDVTPGVLERLRAYVEGSALEARGK